MLLKPGSAPGVGAGVLEETGQSWKMWQAEIRPINQRESGRTEPVSPLVGAGQVCPV